LLRRLRRWKGERVEGDGGPGGLRRGEGGESSNGIIVEVLGVLTWTLIVVANVYVIVRLAMGDA
jgi:Mn2+/Fe2+ NRAMP family transporter